MLYYLLILLHRCLLNDEDRTRFHHCFSHIQSQIVVEVTEEENMSEEALVRKRETEVFRNVCVG